MADLHPSLAIAMREKDPEVFPTLAVEWETWMRGICEEALFHAAKKQFDVTFDEFIEHRLRTAAGEWAVGAVLLQCKFPENLLDHPVIAKMRYEAALLAAIANVRLSLSRLPYRGLTTLYRMCTRLTLSSREVMEATW